MAAQNINLGSTDNTLTLGDGDYVITGGDGNNTLTLGGGTDQLTLGNGNNTLTLGGGTDQITVGSGNNTITTTGTGADTITATGGNNTIVVGGGPDVIVAGDGMNIVTAGDGNDTVTLGAGYDQLTTGNGNSVITVGNGDGDSVTVGTGANTVEVGTGGADTVHLGSGGNIVTVSAAAAATDSILGGQTTGNGGGNELELTTAGLVSVPGVSGFQVYQLSNSGPNNLTLANVNFTNLPGATISVQDGNSGDTVNAAALSAANAVIINAGTGADVLLGGAGNDMFNVGDLAFSSINGGLGTNTLALSSSGLTLTLGSLGNRLRNIQVINLTGTGGNTLNVSAADVLNLSPTTHTLTVAGNASDAVTLLGAGWITGASSGGFTTYTNGLATLLVNTAVTDVGGTGTPAFTNSAALTVPFAGTATITASNLNVSDPNFIASQLTYSVTASPSDGTVMKNGVATTSFSQADINNGLITYDENGTVASSDTFSVTVTDPAGNSVSGSLPIHIQNPTSPVFVNDSTLTVPFAGTATINTSNLDVTDPNFIASQLTYSVTTSPSDGTVMKNGAATTSFTQADINNGLITYHENGTVAASDAFSVTVTDPAGNSVSGSLPIHIQNPTASPVFVNDSTLTVPFAGTATINTSNLDVTDPNFIASQLTYSVTTSPSDGTVMKNGTAATSFTQADINNGLITYHENGTVAASDAFSVTVTDPAGNSVSGSLPVQIQNPITTAAEVAVYYQAILRLPPPGGATGTYATTEAAEITAGSPTVANYQTSLINLDQSLYTTIAALVTVDAFYGATSSSALLTTIATATSGTSYFSAAELHNLGYSDPNVWTILSANWGADPTSQFASLYGADATGTAGGYTTFINAIYQREFGFAPSAANLQNLLNDVPGVTALLSGTHDTATPIQVMSGLEGYLLYVGQTYGIGQYASATSAFLHAAANGTVVYGPELTQEFPMNSQLVAAGSASPTGSGSSSVVTVIGADQLSNAGTGNMIQFLTSVGADTPISSLSGEGQTAGSNGVGLGSLLSVENVDLKSGIAVLGNYPAVTDQRSNGIFAVTSDVLGGNAFGSSAGQGSMVTSIASSHPRDAFWKA